MLIQMKSAEKWHVLGNHFKLNYAIFQRLYLQVLPIISSIIYEEYVVNTCKNTKMRRLVGEMEVFESVPYALYATDVIFQMTEKPDGAFNESKVFFSGKHHLYGVKTEVSVNPSGLAIQASTRFPGSTADIDIFNVYRKFHRLKTTKADDELELEGAVHLISVFIVCTVP